MQRERKAKKKINYIEPESESEEEIKPSTKK